MTTKNIPYKDIGDRLRQWRISQNLKQYEVGEQFGYTTVSWFERGMRLPTSEYLLHIRKTYNVSIDWILTGDNI